MGDRLEPRVAGMGLNLVKFGTRKDIYGSFKDCSQCECFYGNNLAGQKYVKKSSSFRLGRLANVHFSSFLVNLKASLTFLLIKTL